MTGNVFTLVLGIMPRLSRKERESLRHINRRSQRNVWNDMKALQEDPEKIKENLMDLCEYKKAGFVVRGSFEEMLAHSRKSD